jgi:hypothetical protein
MAAETAKLHKGPENFKLAGPLQTQQLNSVVVF